MRAIFLVMFLLAVPGLVLAAPRHRHTTHHRTHRHHVTQPAQQPTAAPTPTASTGDALTTLQTNAQYAVLMDFDTGALLFSKNGDELMKPASMAKLMTVAILFDKLKHHELKLSDSFLVSENAWRHSITEKSAGSKMFVRVGNSIPVEDLIRGIIVQSGNDACIVVAEHFAGSEEGFAALMNAKAKQIGLQHSTFANSNGLPDPRQNVTAHDLALLARYIIKEFPEYYHYFGEKEFTWNKITQPNRNLLLTSYPGADGLKTGHTSESGYGITASAVQGGRRLIVVVNGLKSESERISEVKRLFDIGFREFKTYALLKPGDVVGEAKVWAGARRSVPLTVKQPVNIMLRRASRPGLKVTLTYKEPLVPPIERGTELGTLLITAPGAPDRNVPVFAGANVESGGFLTYMKVGAQALVMGKTETQTAEETSESSTDTPPNDSQ
ncbi:MAG: D-alanyl-D-alanine carboxypeptidase [Alphaproteobacteria bacterium]|nr:D-alanyl-D-alanine carboxypeptidase [Alphaproteobacteria bacterium]